MSKRRVLLADYTQQKLDEGSVEIETADGQVFVVPPPMFWPDDFATIARTGTTVDQAAAMLGSRERLDEFVAAGGRPNLLVSIVTESLQATPGE